MTACISALEGKLLRQLALKRRKIDTARCGRQLHAQSACKTCSEGQRGSASAAGERSRRVLRFWQSCAVTAAYYSTRDTHTHRERAQNNKSCILSSSKHNKQMLQLSNICATGALARCRSRSIHLLLVFGFKGMDSESWGVFFCAIKQNNKNKFLHNQLKYSRRNLTPQNDTHHLSIKGQ